MLPVCGCLLNLLPSVFNWEPDWLEQKKKKKKKKKKILTLSTDLKQKRITNMAAVLWQATEARAPIRSSGQMAVVNAEAQGVDVIRSGSMHKDNFRRPLSEPSRVLKGY